MQKFFLLRHGGLANREIGIAIMIYCGTGGVYRAVPQRL